jgi:hypothetical protein
MIAGNKPTNTANPILDQAPSSQSAVIHCPVRRQRSRRRLAPPALPLAFVTTGLGYRTLTDFLCVIPHTDWIWTRW